MSAPRGVTLTIHVDADPALAAFREVERSCIVQNRLVSAGGALFAAAGGWILGETEAERSARRTDARDTYATARELYDAWQAGER